MTLLPHDKPVFSRDSETATRSMAQRFAARGLGGGGAPQLHRPSGLPGQPTRPATNNGPAHRMITGALGTGRR